MVSYIFTLACAGLLAKSHGKILVGANNVLRVQGYI